MFSTPSMVRSPVRGGVTASSTGVFFLLSSDSHLMGFSFMVFLLSLLVSSLGSWYGLCPSPVRFA